MFRNLPVILGSKPVNLGLEPKVYATARAQPAKLSVWPKVGTTVKMRSTVVLATTSKFLGQFFTRIVVLLLQSTTHCSHRSAYLTRACWRTRTKIPAEHTTYISDKMNGNLTRSKNVIGIHLSTACNTQPGTESGYDNWDVIKTTGKVLGNV